MSSSNLGPGNRRSYTSNVDRIESTQPAGEANQTAQSSGTTKRKGRRNTRGLNVDKHVQNHCLIEINIEEEDGKAVCSHSSKLVSQIGNQFILDLNDPIVYHYLEHEMSSRHRDFRYRLHKHYMQYSSEEARHHKHKDVARDEDWHCLCDRWETEKFKKISETNTRARASVPYGHTAGTIAFLRHKENIKNKEGREVDDIELFEVTHKMMNDEWVSRVAGQKHEQMIELRNAPVEEGAESPSARQISVQVLGRQGALGWGPPTTTTQNERSSQRNRESRNQIAQLQSVVQTQPSLLESAMAQLSQLQETVNRLSNAGEGSSQRTNSQPSNDA